MHPELKGKVVLITSATKGISHVFKKEFGNWPSEYLRDLRVS